jgi:hypothetical protein
MSSRTEPQATGLMWKKLLPKGKDKVDLLGLKWMDVDTNIHVVTELCIEANMNLYLSSILCSIDC